MTIELLKDLQKPFGVIVNKAGLGSDDVYRFLETNKIELLGKIPFSKEYAAEYASGNILNNIPIKIEITYREIIEKLTTKTFLK